MFGNIEGSLISWNKLTNICIKNLMNSVSVITSAGIPACHECGFWLQHERDIKYCNVFHTFGISTSELWTSPMEHYRVMSTELQIMINSDVVVDTPECKKRVCSQEHYNHVNVHATMSHHANMIGNTKCGRRDLNCRGIDVLYIHAVTNYK